MKTKQKEKKPITGFTKNKSLNKYSKQELFKEKVERANHILKTIGLPKGI